MTIKEMPKKNGKRQYSCRVYVRVDGERVTKYKGGFCSKGEAAAWGESVLEPYDTGSYVGKEKSLDSFLTDYIETRDMKISPATIRGYKVNKAHIVRIIESESPKMTIGDLTLLDVQRVLDTLSKEGKKEATCRYVLRFWNTAMKYAIRVGLITKNPCEGAELTPDETPFKYSIYSKELLSDLLFALREQEHWIYPFVLLTSRRGLRRGEALGMKWSDINWAEKYATVERSYGIEDKTPADRKVKTKSSVGTIAIEGIFAEELARIRESRLANGRVTTYICEKDNGDRPNPTHMSHALNSFQKANNFPKCRAHDLRHTYARHQYRGDLDELKRLMRHSKIGITSDLYLHNDQSDLNNAVTQQDNIINFTKVKKTESGQAAQ